MDWIKRNLFFFIFGVVALALMGVSGWYLYSKYQLNNTAWDSLNQNYSELATLNTQNPHPGSGKIDNVKLAKEQQEQVKALIEKVKGKFERIAPIPDMPKVTDRDFSAALSRSIDKLQHDATNASVALPNNYGFSFEAQRPRVTFALGSLDALSTQLGEVKAICDILYQAKVNALDAIRRERVSTDDNSGQLTDYLDKKPVTNDLAIVSHYEVTFRSFTPELAQVLSGFANAANGLILKGMNVEAAPAPPPVEPQQPVYTPAQVYQQVPSAVSEARQAAENAAAFQRRYGIRPGGSRSSAMPQPQQPVYAAPAPAPAKAGLQTVLDEKQLKVTLNISTLKLISTKTSPTQEPATSQPPAQTQAAAQ